MHKRKKIYPLIPVDNTDLDKYTVNIKVAFKSIGFRAVILTVF